MHKLPSSVTGLQRRKSVDLDFRHSPFWPRSRKGKQRARDVDGGTGPGGAGGLVLPLTYIGTDAFDAAYAVPVFVGSSRQDISLQIDTGSSDLWIASTSCSDNSCANVGQDKLYDPSASGGRDTSVPFSITYLNGQVQGEIYWDTVEVGGYSIDNQAFAAASSVADEPLGPSFSGILGLALPSNSIIASLIQPTSGNDPDGAVWASNLFSITPGPDSAETAPSQQFLGLTLSRPGTSKVPSLLGIGMHPPVGTITLPDSLGGTSAQLGYDKVNYHPPLRSVNAEGEDIGYLFWKVSVVGISVWVDGQEKPIQMTKTPGITENQPFLSAVLDTGVPIILTSSAIANGIYGALGIGPASDGNYYLPCTTPLNMTFNILTYASSNATTPTTSSASTASSKSTSSKSISSTSTTSTTSTSPSAASTPITIPYSVHPLDLSDPSSSSSSCTSLLQADDAGLAKAGSDMILGVPFLRGVYFVMGYEQPTPNGSFPVLAAGDDINPLLGLQTLLDPANSLEEFNRVRVDNEPLDSDPACPNGFCGGDSNKKTLSVGIDVLIGLAGVIGLMCIIGTILWIISARARRREQELTGMPLQNSKNTGPLAFLVPKWLHRSDKRRSVQYQPAKSHERSDSDLRDGRDLSEDDLRRIRYEKFLANADEAHPFINRPLRSSPLHRPISRDDENIVTMSSGKTKVGDSPTGKKDSKERESIDDFAWRKEKEVRIEDLAPDLIEMPIPSLSERIASHDARQNSELAPVNLPLIPPPSASSLSRRNSTSLLPSPTLLGSRSNVPPRNVVSEYQPDAEFGEVSGGMAGIGTATRSKRGLRTGLEFSPTDENVTASPPKPPTEISPSFDERNQRIRL